MGFGKIGSKLKDCRLRPGPAFIVLFVFLSGARAGLPGGLPGPLCLAVSSMSSPGRTLDRFSVFRDYLGRKLARPVIIKQRRTYNEINSLLFDGRADMAWTCTGGYLAGRKARGLEILAVPVIGGRPEYHSYIIVGAESPAERLADLKGTVFAFTDPLSLTGRIYPTVRIRRMGFEPSDFFKKTFYTESHDKAIEAVANGLADAAAVDSLIFDSLRRSHWPPVSRVRIIDVSPAFGAPPLVVSLKMARPVRQAVLKILLDMDSEKEGQKVLRGLGVDGFVLPSPAIYRSAFVFWKDFQAGE